MKSKLPLLIVVMLWGIYSTAINAQTSVNASGETLKSSGGSASISVGQVFYSHNKTASLSTSEGVQQPYEISVISSVKKARDIELDMQAFPNPTTDLLQLKISEKQIKNLSWQLLNANGEVQQIQNIESETQTIYLAAYPQGIYFLRVLKKGNDIKTFKIIKQ